MQISHHDMWRDEIHSWGLVLASPSLVGSFRQSAFHRASGRLVLILWLASFFTDSPYTVQVVHAVIALVLIGTIGLLSPFSRLERLLLLSSYFVLFEYTVISRNYGLGFLIALIYAEMRATAAGPPLSERAVCSGCSPIPTCSRSSFQGRSRLNISVDLLYEAGKAGQATLEGSVAAGAGLSRVRGRLPLATMWPSPDISWRTTGRPLAQCLGLELAGRIVAGNVETPLADASAELLEPRAKGISTRATRSFRSGLAFVYLLHLSGAIAGCSSSPG